MAHIQQVEFCTAVKNAFPEKFRNCSVLDIGSLDINGNNRYLFEDYKYIGLDIGPGKNVDVVSKGHEYNTEERFDIIISTECFEHDKFYDKTIRNAIRLLKPGGLLLFSCATTGRHPHGIAEHCPESSPHSHVEFDNYYKNVTEADVRETVNVAYEFSQYAFSTNPVSCDLYFWGIKK